MVLDDIAEESAINEISKANKLSSENKDKKGDSTKLSIIYLVDNINDCTNVVDFHLKKMIWIPKTMTHLFWE